MGIDPDVDLENIHGTGMLLLNGEPILRDVGKQEASCILSYLYREDSIRAQAATFLDSSPPQGSHTKTISVLQGEFAVINMHQERQEVRLSSCEATTCCIVALGCDISGRYGIAHYDKPQAQHEDCLGPLLDGLIAPELYITGGFVEETGCGIATAERLLQVMHNCDTQINIRLACVGDVNTASDGTPKCCSLLLTSNVNAGCAPTPSDTIDKGPLAIQRMTRNFAQQAAGLENVYDTSKQQLQIKGVHLNLSAQQILSFSSLLGCPDSDILRIMSTSPQHEAATFVPGTICLLHDQVFCGK